ncbi:hypothetical protein [Cytobacillus oceanisediminis]|uniref:hypothetical protein n=1 Tax=Cytobacillus oceanisediminis TaxID=665099 RepID=UPI003735B8DC
MTKKDTLELFKFLKSVFSQFEVDQYKIDTWTKLLANQNPAVVMKNAERHALESKFPPTIAELREIYHPAYHSNIIQKVEQWEREASGKK